MATYLLAVTVGRLEGVTRQSASGMNVTMWAVPGLQGQLGVALQVSFLAGAGGLELVVRALLRLQQRRCIVHNKDFGGLANRALQVGVLACAGALMWGTNWQHTVQKVYCRA